MLALLVVVALASAARGCVHGTIFPDNGACECFDGFKGPACDQADSGPLDVSTNQGFLWEQLWGELEGEPTTTIDSLYRLAYQEPEVFYDRVPGVGIGERLRRVIFDLHDKYANAEVDGYNLVIGYGVSHLINAFQYANKEAYGHVHPVFSQKPFYYLLPEFAALNPGLSSWNASTEQPQFPLDDHPVEILVSPQNPTGRVGHAPIYDAGHVVDGVFYWPSYTDVDGRLDAETIMFSLSKLTGHSGTRIGWALVKDAEIARLMGDYLYVSTHGISVDAMYRALVILEVFSGSLGDDMFAYVRARLNERYDLIQGVLEHQTEFSIESERGFCVLWVRCPTENCIDTFATHGILGRDGVEFGTPGFIRLNLMLHDATFGELLARLQRMFAQ